MLNATRNKMNYRLSALMIVAAVFGSPAQGAGESNATSTVNGIRAPVAVKEVSAAVNAVGRVRPPAAATDTGSHVVLPVGKSLGEKATMHRYEKLRAGAVKTAQGWKVQDFASSFFNPNPEEITVTMRLVSDDPKFQFANGQAGTYTKIYKLRPMQGDTDNIYIGSLAFGKPEWPVATHTCFTGSVEFSSTKPFYYYFLRETEVGEAPDATDAYFAAWKAWTDEVPAGWDEDLKQFVFPYSNYWHNEKNWPVGWHSVLALKNNAEGPVTITLKHIPYYGGQFNPKNGQMTHYQEQVAEVVLQKGEMRNMKFQDLFGWAADQMSSMEGCLLVGLSPGAARTRITLHLLIVPNESGERLHDAFR